MMDCQTGKTFMTILSATQSIESSQKKRLSITQKYVIEMMFYAYFITAIVAAIFVKLALPHASILVILYYGIIWPTWLIPACINVIHLHVIF
jgi:hypothetical protein